MFTSSDVAASLLLRQRQSLVDLSILNSCIILVSDDSTSTRFRMSRHPQLQTRRFTRTGGLVEKPAQLHFPALSGHSGTTSTISSNRLVTSGSVNNSATGFPRSDRGHHVPARTVTSGERGVGSDVACTEKEFSWTRTALNLEAWTPRFQ